MLSRMFAICLGSAALICSVRAQDQPTAPRRITLEEAQNRAASASDVMELARLNAKAAAYHRQAAQADYFPKIGASLINEHFNKFLGQQIQVRNRTAQVPLMNRDQTVVAVTIAQPITQLLKVHQGVQIARGDEITARAKAGAAGVQLSAQVERAYFELLIAQRQQTQAEIKVKMLKAHTELASNAAPPFAAVAGAKAALLEASKTQVLAESRATDLTTALDLLIGLPAETALELSLPPPIAEEISSPPQPTPQAIDQNPEVVEATEALAKARAASALSKLDYVPDVAVLGGYAYQTAIPLLPNDFSFLGVAASWNVFDSGKREQTIRERSTQVRMAEVNLAMVRAKVTASIQKASLDLQRTHRILELTRQIAASNRTKFENTGLESAEARAGVEEEIFQAELDYRLAYSDWKRVLGTK